MIVFFSLEAILSKSLIFFRFAFWWFQKPDVSALTVLAVESGVTSCRGLVYCTWQWFYTGVGFCLGHSLRTEWAEWWLFLHGLPKICPLARWCLWNDIRMLRGGFDFGLFGFLSRTPLLRLDLHNFCMTENRRRLRFLLPIATSGCL